MCRADRIWHFFIVAVSWVLIAQTCRYVWRAHDLMIDSDEWAWIADYRRIVAGRYPLANWFAQHNEHRIFTTRLTLYADTKLFSLSGGFALTLNLLLLAASGYGLWRLARAAGGRLPAAFFVAWMLSLCNYENLLSPFQIQFAYAVFFAVAAVCAAAAATGPALSPAAAAWRYGAALVMVLLSTFSLGGGMLIAPGVLLLLWLRRVNPRLLACAAAALAVVVALYLHNYHYAPPADEKVAGWQKLPLLAKMLVRFCGNVVQEAAYPLGAGALLGATLAGSLAVRNRWRGTSTPAASAALLALSGFAIANGTAAALHRSWLGPDAALAPRYTVFTLLLLPSVAHLLLPRQLPGSARAAAQAVALLLLLRLHTAPLYYIAEDARRAALLPIATALRSGQQPAMIGFLSYAQRKPDIDFMRAHHLNLFRKTQ